MIVIDRGDWLMVNCQWSLANRWPDAIDATRGSILRRSLFTRPEGASYKSQVGAGEDWHDYDEFVTDGLLVNCQWSLVNIWPDAIDATSGSILPFTRPEGASYKSQVEAGEDWHDRDAFVMDDVRVNPSVDAI
ncbi:MAG: hypothetical protein H6585_01535 [Flavobacteriales bacterium]|nr:hypothetical protein [Flavobacteriales bacterium]